MNKTNAEVIKDKQEVVEKKIEVTDKKLDTIHVLVNSNMTSAMQSELDTLRRELVLLIQLDDPSRADGTAKNKAASSLAIERTKIKIGELQAKLDERAKAAKALEETVKASVPEVK